MTIDVWESDAYLVRRHRRDPERLIVVLTGGVLSRHVRSRVRGFDAERLWQARYAAVLEDPRRLPPPDGWADLTQGAVTDQSSASRWSCGSPAEDSAGAVAGAPTGRFGFHTAKEDQPWWSIDFGRDVVVRLVRIYNRMDMLEVAERGIQFAIDVADARGDWREVLRKVDGRLFGGADGDPFEWSPVQGVAARRLRIRALQRGVMHYDRIEIFG